MGIDLTRTDELFHALLEYLQELIHDDSELRDALRHCGFSEDEIVLELGEPEGE